MLFLTLADRSGLAECVLFPDAYRRWGAAMRGEAVRAEGRVDDALGALTLVVERVTQPIATRAGATPVDTPSRRA